MVGREEDLIKDYNDKVNIQDIKYKYKVAYETLKDICIKYNVWNNIKERADSNRRRGMDKIRNVKHNPFINLEDRETQYWLGLLATDGGIYRNRITLGLNSKDLEHIEKYKIFINSNLPIYKTEHSKYKGHFMSNFSFSSISVTNFLINLGITRNKSKTLDIKIPITWDFLRGVIDGDGCISFFKNKNKKEYNCCISIVSASKLFIDKIKKFFDDNLIKNRLYLYKNLYRIHIINFVNCKMLIEFLYKNADIYLERKYLKAQFISNYKLKKDLKFREPA